MVASHEHDYMDHKAQIFQRFARAFMPEYVLKENSHNRLKILDCSKIGHTVLGLRTLNGDYSNFFSWKFITYMWGTIEKYRLKFHEVKYMSYRLSIEHPDSAWQGDVQYITTLVKRCREWNNARKSEIL